MFDRVLNMPLDYLSCFAMILRGIHRKVDICQTDYSIVSKLRIFPYSKVIHGSATFKLTKGLERLKKNNQLLNLIFLFFLSRLIRVINRSSMKFLSPEVALYLYKSTTQPCMESCCHV